MDRVILATIAAAFGIAIASATTAASADCLAAQPNGVPPNAVCEIVKLGWRVVDPGPPIRFRPDDGDPDIELAVSRPGRPRPGNDPVRWAETQFSALGPLDCRGSLPDGAKIAAVDCVVLSTPDRPRKGGMVVIATMIGLQVVGLVMPADTDVAALMRTRIAPVIRLFANGYGVGVTARAARDAMFGGRAHYLAPGAGIPASAIEGVYHYWNWMPAINMGMNDTGADYVLFRSGDTWRSPDAAPQDIDLAKAKEARWDDWGTWRRAGDDIILTMNGEAEERLASHQLIRYDPASTDQRVEGSWQSSLAAVAQVAGSTASAVAFRSIALHADGRFERDGFNSASFSNQTGSTTAGGTFATTVPARGGRYRIDGYALKLIYDDGRNDSALFYWAGGQDDRYRMLFINGVKFLGGVLH
jgi:hypothetical protein